MQFLGCAYANEILTMIKLLFIVFSLALSTSAMAAYKCEGTSGTTYSSSPCPNGSNVNIKNNLPNADVIAARKRNADDTAKLNALSAQREREQFKANQSNKTKLADTRKAALHKKSCEKLALRAKRAKEDTNHGRTLKAQEKTKRSATRAAENYDLECTTPH